jgi:hypothetical protein
MINMTANKERLYWKSNKEWYTIDFEKDDFVLTEKAPERAIRSFELWKNGKKEKSLKKAI